MKGTHPGRYAEVSEAGVVSVESYEVKSNTRELVLHMHHCTKGTSNRVMQLDEKRNG